MKKIIFLLTAFILCFAVQAQTKTISIDKSTAKWKGYKVIGSHEGTINFQSGYLIFKKDKLRGGSFVMDMKSISTTDLEGSMKAKLDGHLKNDDFFSVEKFPTATLTFKTIKTKKSGGYSITAYLTLKGVKKTVEFDMDVQENSATATITIDRSQYGISYGSDSSLGDKMIKNDFDVEVSLAF